MNIELQKKILEKAVALVSFDYSKSDPTKDDSKMSLDFFVSGVLHNYGTKKSPSWKPLAINKRSVSSLFTSMSEYVDMEDAADTHEGRVEILGAYPKEKMARKIVGSYDKDSKTYKNGLLGGTILEIVGKELAQLHEVEDMKSFVPDSEEMDLAFRAMLTSMSKTIADLDNSPSAADPFLTVKRIFTKVSEFKFLEVAEDPAAIVVQDIEGQIAKLKELQETAKSVGKEEYINFLKAKKEANGLDEDGYVKLKGSRKEEKKEEAK